MSGPPTRVWSQTDEIRRLVAPLALAIAIVAAVVDRGSVADTALGLIPVAAFAVWSVVPATPLAAVSAAVIVPVVAAQQAGALEPLFFEVSLLAFVVGRWVIPLRLSATLGEIGRAHV